MENIALAYTNIVIPEDKTEILNEKRGLLSSNKNMRTDDFNKSKQPIDRIQEYVGILRKKRMEINNE